MFWFFNGIIVLFLIVTLVRIGQAIASEDEAKKKYIGIEIAWGLLLVVLLLYNFRVINF